MSRTLRAMRPWMIGATSVLLLFTLPATAQTPAIPRVTMGVDTVENPQDLAITLQVLLLLTILTLAPSILVMMTSFIRLVVAFHFLRQALGTQNLPPNQVLVGLVLFLTIFIMSPVITDIYDNAWLPYSRQEITLEQGWERAQDPLRDFMLAHTREKDLQVFVQIADLQQPATPDDLPMRVIIPGFIISELRVGFQIGFLIYMPMLIIDMVVASVLMSMGMMMLPPMMISLPFKLLLFVLVDGWYLVVQSLVESFR
ncbi:flagellar type III secretion system pore protein FliP [bacterium]|nr:flagellar type III secretion system pore protein FliP [bacterium]